MPRITLKLDKTGLRFDANTIAAPAVKSTIRRVFNRSQILCPVDNGYLRSTGRPFFKDTARGPGGGVEYTASYAAAVHNGSGPHIIRARKKKALRFEYQGETVIVKSVRHPGTKAQPFLQQAAEEIAAAEGDRFKPRA